MVNEANVAIERQLPETSAFQEHTRLPVGSTCRSART